MKFLVLGAGRQGIAIIHDILRRSGHSVTVADRDRTALELAQKRFPEVGVTTIDLNELWDVARALTGVDVCISAAPYFYNLVLARTAIENRVHFCDLGGSTQIVLKELQLDRHAREQGVVVIPDCGLSPGTTNILAAHVMSKQDQVDTLEIRVGGLPFSTPDLLNRYIEPAGVIENGMYKRVDAMTGVEPVCFNGYPELEAFYTHGGVSTLPESYSGRLRNLNHKTIGHQGFADWLRPILRDSRFKSRREIAAYLESTLRQESPDVVLVRVSAIGPKARVDVEVIDTADEKSGFSAMMRTCGFSAAIVAEMLAAGKIPPGAHAPEKVIPPDEFIAELGKRGIHVNIRNQVLGFRN